MKHKCSKREVPVMYNGLMSMNTSSFLRPNSGGGVRYTVLVMFRLWRKACAMSVLHILNFLMAAAFNMIRNDGGLMDGELWIKQSFSLSLWP